MLRCNEIVGLLMTKDIHKEAADWPFPKMKKELRSMPHLLHTSLVIIVNRSNSTVFLFMSKFRILYNLIISFQLILFISY